MREMHTIGSHYEDSIFHVQTTFEMFIPKHWITPHKNSIGIANKFHSIVGLLGRQIACYGVIRTRASQILA